MSDEGYFSRVWPPLVVYLVSYELALRLGIPTATLVRFFQVVHLFHLALLIRLAQRNWRAGQISRTSLLFWSAISLVVVLPGNYLEFPADPLEHLRRTLTWQSWPTLTQNDVHPRMTYFWAWSWIADVPIAWRRSAFGFYGGVWQLIVLYQFYRLLGALKVAQASRYVGVVSYLAFFGTGLFGLRYYALAPFMLSLVALYGAYIIVIEEGPRDWRRCLVLLILPLVLMQRSHPGQELGNFLLATLPLVGFFAFGAQPASRKKTLLKGIVILGATGILGVLLLRKLAPALFLDLQTAYSLSQFGGLSIFDERTRLFSSLGVVGLIGFFVAFFFLRAYPLLALMTMTPVFVLVWPPSGLLLMSLLGERGSSFIYRVLYAFPTSAILAVFASLRFPRWRFVIVAVVILLGAMPQSPFFGRLFFQFYQAPNLLTLQPLDQTAQWFAQNQNLNRMRGHCRLIADDLSFYAMSTHLALPMTFGKMHPTHEIQNSEMAKDPVNHVVYQAGCGLLIADPEKVPPFPLSKLGSLSGHWPSDFAHLKNYQPQHVEHMLATMKAAGWRAVLVPPWYWYFENPHPPPKPQ